jgi:hypothetical protein
MSINWLKKVPISFLNQCSTYKNSSQRFVDEQGLARSFTFSNISLTITYVTVVIAALMLAGFLWMAFAYSGSGSSGYGGYRQKREVFFDDDPENYPEGTKNCIG